MKNLFAFILILMIQSVFSQAPITSTKMELFGDHLFIQLNVDGSEPLDFVFDTGDGLPVIDLDIAKQLGLDLNHSAAKTSAQGAIQGALIDHNTIELNGIELESDIQLYATSLNHLEMSIGRNIDGIIGYDLLHHYVVKLNYDEELFELYDPKTYQSGKGESLEFKLDSYIPHISGTVKLNNGEVLEGEFFLNTGAGTTLDFNTRYAKKNSIVDKTGDHFSYPVAGLGNKETIHYEGRVEEFSFGLFKFSSMPVGISTAEQGIQNNKKVSGILGNKVLKKFNITFDYSRSRIYFTQSKNFSSEMKVNASGIYLQMNQSMDKVLVHRVYENSPASNSGIKQESEIKMVNGKAVNEYSLPELRELLNEANTTVELTIIQDGVEKRVKLDLKSLI